ncbi:hypothetical protein C8Q80DRAFT_606401 [Daedaleopsis nitida]|nr:hypothetical protein C8Q80DRAFT_606401 [Daedaleopsis nitida]
MHSAIPYRSYSCTSAGCGGCQVRSILSSLFMPVWLFASQLSPNDTDSVLDIIRGSPRLRKLRLSIHPDRDFRYEVVVRKILDSVSPESEMGALQSITIELEPLINYDLLRLGSSAADRPRYFCDRNSLLDSLAALMVHETFPKLHELYFKLFDHDDVHDSAWWKAQLVQRAPHSPEWFHSVVVVEVRRGTDRDGYPWQYLWSVGELPKSDAGTVQANAGRVDD